MIKADRIHFGKLQFQLFIDDIRRSKESLLIHTKPYFGYNQQKIDTNSVRPAKQYQTVRSTTSAPSTTTSTTVASTTKIPIRYNAIDRNVHTTTQTYLTSRQISQAQPHSKSASNSKHLISISSINFIIDYYYNFSLCFIHLFECEIKLIYRINCR